MAFRAAVVVLVMSSKCLPFNISFIFGGIEPVKRQGVPTQLFV
jgi:hypothetical protein